MIAAIHFVEAIIGASLFALAIATIMWIFFHIDE
jgi:hypothetical protein